MAVRLDKTQLAARYGYASAFFNASPELQRLLSAAVSSQWTAEEFSARLMNTSWYKYHSAGLKEWQALKAKEPAEANRRLGQRTNDLKTQAAKLGVAVTPYRLQQMAEQSLMYSWDNTQTSQALAGEMRYTGTGQMPPGDVSSLESRIRESAQNYGVSLNEKDIFSMAQKATGGAMSEDGINEFIKNLAVSRYPGLADDIKRGMSVREVASAYVQSQARILEVDPNQVDLASDKMLQKAFGYVDPATNKPAPMPIWQYEQALRKDPRWLNTTNARDDMSNVGMKVLTDMGLVTQ